MAGMGLAGLLLSVDAADARAESESHMAGLSALRGKHVLVMRLCGMRRLGAIKAGPNDVRTLHQCSD